jgi:glycosyltransferase involved in cell wall biosynthesis
VRIAVFCPEFGAIGGIERKAESLIREFRACGHRVVVLARGDDGATAGDPPVFRTRFHGVPRRVGALGRRFRYAMRRGRAVTALRAAASDFGADAVLSLSVSAFSPYALGLSAVAPLVYCLEGREAGGVFTATPRVLARTLRAATHVIGCSTSLVESACALVPAVRSRITMIPNGVDVDRFGTGPAFRHPRPYVLAVGRLARQKGFDVLLRAFVDLAPVDPPDLLVAGDGPERADLVSLADRLGLRPRVHFLGAVDQATVASLYRGAAVVASPSRWEGLPLVVLEGMAAGRAVVAAAVDGVPDAIAPGETGILVAPEDTAALAAALEDLLGNDAERARLGAAARAAAERAFVWPQIAARYLDVLARVTAPRRAAG